MPKILAIIQARMSSERLPRKVLEYFSGDTTIGHIVRRVRLSKYIDEVVVATGDINKNQALIDYCAKQQIKCFAGCEDDVLDRFYNVMQALSPSYIVRVTADDPFKDPEIIDLAISHILADSELDYVSNTLIPTYPEGLDIEVFKSSALELAHKSAKLMTEREHVTPYIWKNVDKFKILNFKNDDDLSNLRWTVDYPEDLEFVKMVYKHFETMKMFYMLDILDFINDNPEISRTSKNVIRNQGYLKGLKNEVSQD